MRRGRSLVALLLLAIHIGGCFRYAPIAVSSAQPGSTISIGINDQGRVGLAERIGPGVLRVHGHLIETNDSAVAVGLNSVEFMDLNVPARMSGQRVEIPRAYTTDIRERQLARSRTALTIALAVVGLVATSLIAISGFGGDTPSDRENGGGGGGQQ